MDKGALSVGIHVRHDCRAPSRRRHAGVSTSAPGLGRQEESLPVGCCLRRLGLYFGRKKDRSRSSSKRNRDIKQVEAYALKLIVSKHRKANSLCACPFFVPDIFLTPGDTPACDSKTDRLAFKSFFSCDCFSCSVCRRQIEGAYGYITLTGLVQKHTSYASHV